MSGCTQTGKRVQILLSTYNGEKYLREQLDSYLTQTCARQMQVLIRDDGSTDGTVEILREYAAAYGFEVVFGENLGVNGSYQWLIAHSSPDCDYFAFSDQDDVWLPEKLALAVTALDGCLPGNPALFASRTQVTDASLKPIGVSALPVRGISFYNAMVQNVLPGHTQVFNRALRDILCAHGCLEAHVVDWWLYLTASAVGEIVFSETGQVLHRQHGNNSVGYRLTFFSQLTQRMQALRQGKGNAVSRQLLAFHDSWGDVLAKEYAQELRDYLNSLGDFFSRSTYLRRSRVFRQKPMEDRAFRLLYLLGKYNLDKEEHRGE